MACGVGACLCCVENTTEGHLCVCKEGPFSIRIDCYGRFKCKYREVTTEKSRNDRFRHFRYGLEFADFVNLEDIGGIIVKGTTLKLVKVILIPAWQRRLKGC